MKTSFLIISLFLICLSLCTAFQNTVEKSLLFFDTISGFTSPLFHTKHGSISFSGESTSSGSVPQYLLIDFSTPNATRILTDIMKACDNRMYLFSKLFYHEQTSSLVYYCTNNNTLLILDEDTFTVQDSIIVGTTTVFQETRLAADGDHLVVIGINGFYALASSPSQFIRFSLLNKKVVDNFTLDQHLGQNEIIVGFASNGSQRYAATNQFSYYANMTVYSLDLTQNGYKLTHLLTSSHHYYFPYSNGNIPQVYCVGDLVATNANNFLVFLNQSGHVIYNVSDLQYNMLPFKTDNVYASEDPIFSKGRGNNTLYAAIQNQDRDHLTMRFTIEGQSVNASIIEEASLNEIVIGNNEQSDLLITTQYITSFNLLNVIDTETSETIYSMISSYDDIMTTNLTFAVRSYSMIAIFNRMNNTLLGTVGLSRYDTPYYHDVDNGFLYFINSTYGVTGCSLIYVDLQTAYNEEVYYFVEENVCNGKIVQLNSSLPLSPQAVIQTKDASFLIITNEYGKLNFSTPSNFQQSYIIPNYETLSVQQIVFNYDIFGGWNLYQYEYDQTLKNFTLKNSTSLANMEFGNGNFAYYYFGDGRVFAVSNMMFTEIDLASGSTKVYTLLENWPTLSMLHDMVYNPFIIFSNDQNKAGNAEIYLYESGRLGALKGTNDYSVRAGATGLCEYYVGDGLISNVKLVKIYNICSNGRNIIYE